SRRRRSAPVRVGRASPVASARSNSNRAADSLNTSERPTTATALFQSLSGSRLNDPKAELHVYLQRAVDALVWKLDGLSEHEIRRPMTTDRHEGAGWIRAQLKLL